MILPRLKRWKGFLIMEFESPWHLSLGHAGRHWVGTRSRHLSCMGQLKSFREPVDSVEQTYERSEMV